MEINSAALILYTALSIELWLEMAQERLSVSLMCCCQCMCCYDGHIKVDHYSQIVRNSKVYIVTKKMLVVFIFLKRKGSKKTKTKEFCKNCHRSEQVSVCRPQVGFSFVPMSVLKPFSTDSSPCLLSAATNGLLHVCAAVLPAQPDAAVAQDSGAVLLSAVVGPPAQDGTLPCSHAPAEQRLHQRRLHVSFSAAPSHLPLHYFPK